MNKPRTNQVVSIVPVSIQARATKLKRKMNLKPIAKICSVILFAILLSPTISIQANESTKESSSSIFFNETNYFDINKEDQIDFNVNYLLDENGKPYIISIQSKDERMTQLVKKMIGVECSNTLHKKGEWFIITFIYNNIQ